MRKTNNIISLEEKSKEYLGNDIFTLAQEWQGGKRAPEEVSAKIGKIMQSGFFHRNLLVEILEEHDDILSTTTRFYIIDIHDMIIAIQRRNKAIHSIIHNEGI